MWIDIRENRFDAMPCRNAAAGYKAKWGRHYAARYIQGVIGKIERSAAAADQHQIAYAKVGLKALRKLTHERAVIGQMTPRVDTFDIAEVLRQAGKIGAGNV